MYNKFFGITRNPFEISPDPYFLLPTPRHKEALASIYYGVSRRKGFVVLTGEVGTGKTLMVRCLFELLKGQQVLFANIFNPRLSPREFLTSICYELGVKPTDSTKGNLLWDLYRFLVAQHRKGVTTVLVVDEAQQLPAQVLEEIRLLTNLETSQEKLLQIVLVGQPELDIKLDSPELRQLKQRISVRCRLEPMQEEETRNYIYNRLRLAGAAAQAETIFPDETIAEVYRYSRGIPRLINTICDQSLVAAFARQVPSVDPQIVEEIALNFRLQVVEGQQIAGDLPTLEDNRAAAGKLLQIVESLERAAGGNGPRPVPRPVTTKPI